MTGDRGDRPVSGAESGPGAGSEDDPETLARSLVEEAARLTRLARRASDPAEREAYQSDRDRRLDEAGYAARVREEDDTLVCYPSEWLVDGVVQFDRIDDVDRGVEVPLSGPGDGDDWAAVEADNAAVVDAVAAEHGDPHATTARALADFMGNHYAKRIERATAAELREFREEYFVRNAWPTEDQRRVLETSLMYTFEAAGTDPPLELDPDGRD
jgi:hypothetical protein